MFEQVSGVVNLQAYVKECLDRILFRLHTTLTGFSWFFITVIRLMLGWPPGSRTQYPSSKSFPTHHS
jgi:hypothetical protein